MRDEESDKLKTLLHWTRNAKRSQKGNYRSALHFARLHLWLGIPAAVLATAVGTSIFASFSNSPLPTSGKITVGLVSLLAAILSSLQTLLSFGDRSAKHRAAAAEYGMVKREIEELILRLKSSGDLPFECFSQIRKKLDSLARETPQVPDRIWAKVQKEMPSTPFTDYFLAEKQPSEDERQSAAIHS